MAEPTDEGLPLTDVTVIGENPHYKFAIGKAHGRWLGFALGKPSRSEAAFVSEGLPVQARTMFVFPEVAEGFMLGLTERERAILLTGAIAQDFESAYGGVERWFVPPDLRGDPDKLRCPRCDRIGCDGVECEECEGEELP
jgi:hypothetical protein